MESSKDLDQNNTSKSFGNNPKKTELSQSIIDNISLSTKSKTMLIIRILFFALLCIFIPMQTILYVKLEKIEREHLSKNLVTIIPERILSNKVFYNFSYVLSQLFGGKDLIIIYIGIVYLLFHPFIALKLVTVTNTVYYGIVILQCLYQGHRPFWEDKNTENPICSINYGNPSGNFFLITFFILYLVASFSLVEKKKHLSILAKCFICFTYLVVVFLSGIILLVYKLHYLYQLVFSLIISLALVCLFIDLDHTIHNFILKSLKNVFKTRKYKMKIFFYVLAAIILSVMIFFFIPDDLELNKTEDYLTKDKFCGKKNLDLLGVKDSFSDIAYLFGIVGAFWGASYTVEKECGVWWNSSMLNLLFKTFCSLSTSILYIYLSKFIPKATYEFNFIIDCLIYFFHYYIIMGLLPWGFDIFALNQKVDFEVDGEDENFYKKQNSQLFQKTIFSSQKFSKKDIDYLTTQTRPLLKEDDNEANGGKPLMSEENANPKEGSIYKKSVLIKDVGKHEEGNGLEFQVDNKSQMSLEDKKDDDDYFNQNID